MSDFRVRYGHSIGPEGTYNITSGKTLFGESDTTPDVSDGVLFYSQNTTATLITHFDVAGAGGQPGTSFHQGKRIVVFYKDGSTGVLSGAQVNLINTSGAAYPAGTVAEYFYHNSAWYEMNRIAPTQVPAPFQNLAGNVVVGSFGVNVTTTNVLVLNASGGGAQLQSLSGGQVGQFVTIVNGSSNALTISADGIGNIRAGTSATILPNSGAITLLNYGPAWIVVRGAAAN